MSKCVHYEFINGDNIGRCRYCGQVRDYNPKTRRSNYSASARGGRRSGETRRIKGVKDWVK